MEVFKSKFRYNYDHTGLIILGFLVGVGIIRFITDPSDFIDDKNRDKLLIGAIFLLAGFLYILFLILKVPRITIDNQVIKLKSIFKESIVSWNEVNEIILAFKKNRGFLLNPGDATILHLKNNTKIHIWIMYYKNAPEMKSLLEKINYQIQNNLPIELNKAGTSFKPTNAVISRDNLQFEEFIKYTGNPYFSFNALIFFACSIGLIIATFPTIKAYPARSPILLIPIIALYFGLGFQLHYFLLSNNYLIIKNHFWWWRNHSYNLSEVREIVFEQPYKWSKTMRVITKDFKEKSYPAGSLRNKQWKEFRKHLSQLNITTRS